MIQPLTIKNARVWDGEQAEVRDLFTTDVVLDKPPLGALTIDLEGYSIFPGLINAHDHLELNHYPRSKFREIYNNAHEWGEDMNARLNESPYKELRAYPLADRLFIGGLKNLLCGATTVAHHNPPHKELFRKDFPVRVLKNYGWAHSLHFNTQAEVVESYRKTPKDWPWFIHLAEGTDEVAAGEYKRLKALGCVGKNTVIVHGVGIVVEDAVEAHSTVYWGSIGVGGVKIIWCPTTNYYLLRRTLGGRVLAVHSRCALGSDSRLTADGDLLDEMRQATYENTTYGAYMAVKMATEEGAKMFCIPQIGNLAKNAISDFVAIPRSNTVRVLTNKLSKFDNEYYHDLLAYLNQEALILCNARRADLALVVKGGIPQIGDPEVMAKFPHVETIMGSLDGVPKAIQVDLARRILRCSLKEPGLEIREKPERRRIFGFI